MSIEKIQEKLVAIDNQLQIYRKDHRTLQQTIEIVEDKLVDATDKKDALTDQLIKALNKQKENQ